MRILITGGAGFIGSHLCERLLGAGNEVICLDSFFSGSRANVLHLLKNPLFELTRHNVIDPFKAEVDQIYNLACPASPIHYQQNPIETLKTSVIGALNCLELAKQNRARILQASTSEIYGDPAIGFHPQSESYWGNVNPIGVRACYNEGKRAAETLFMDYHRQNSIDIRIARIFNTYGPHMCLNDGRVVSNFIVQALRGKDITVYGEGQQTRSFCYCDDIVDGLVRMMNQNESTGPVNLGTTDEIMILDLARKIIKLTGSDSKIIHQPLPSEDPKQRRPDVQMARNILNWSPKISLEEGLLKTINHFKKILSEERGF